MLVRALRTWSPWSPADAIRWAVVAVTGHVLWIAGWWLAHREAVFGDQIRWATLAVAGFVIAAYSDVSWLLRARWAILRRREALFPSVETLPVELAGGELVVAGPGRDRFHTPSCPFAAGRGWSPVSRSEATAAGQAPCGVCEP